MIVISRIDAHAGARNAILAEGNARRNSLLLKGSIVFVEVELVRLGVVGEKNIGPAVTVVIKNREAQALGSVIEKVRFLRRVFELAVAQVVPKPCARAFIRLRGAIRLVSAIEGAEQVSLNRPLHI